MKLLRGESDPRLERSGLEGVSTFGVLSEYRGKWLTRVLRRCITAGFVGFSGDDRPVVVLTEAGRQVMHARRPARLVLPPLTPERRPAGGARRGHRAAPEELEATPEEIALFEALRAHRLELSRELGVPPYVVAHDRTLAGLARQRPGSHEELLLVDGIGPSKAERFGAGFLDVLARHAPPG